MKMFQKILLLFLGLGLGPILLIAVVFSLPYHLQIDQYKNLIGLLLILSTVSTLCLGGLVTRVLKDPLNKLLRAQKEVRHGHLGYRLPVDGNDEFQMLFSGFNKMAEGIEQASKQERELVEANTFNKLASQVIHDLRSPLGSLKIASDYFLEKGSADETTSKYANLLRLGTQRVQEITEDLLNQRREMTTRPPKFSLNKIIEELLAELQAQNKYPELEIKLQLCASHPNLSGISTDFKRAINNILVNAVEAMNGKGLLTIRTECRENIILAEIVDTGPGMPPEILEKVLKGGFTYNKQNGNGIGMTVVRETVEKYHGPLHAQSHMGLGTAFQLQFPLQTQLPAT